MKGGGWGGWEKKHTRLRSPDEMELIELRVFWPMAPPLTPRGVLSEDMMFFFFFVFLFRRGGRVGREEGFLVFVFFFSWRDSVNQCGFLIYIYIYILFINLLS